MQFKSRYHAQAVHQGKQDVGEERRRPIWLLISRKRSARLASNNTTMTGTNAMMTPMISDMPLSFVPSATTTGASP